jgi:predicted dehydrogenase
MSGQGVVVAVASRDPALARRLVTECQADEPFDTPPAVEDSYEGLLARSDVEAVYVPLPTGVRLDWMQRAVAAGKHVLGEKPAAPSAAALAELLHQCRARGLQFMDGTMFSHSQRLDAIRRVLADGVSVGSIRRVTTAFTFAADAEFAARNIRADARLEPQGCLGDLGWYCLRFIGWSMGGRLPEWVSARRHQSVLGPGGEVPGDVTAELGFGDGVTAGLHCSFAASDQQWAVISGDRGVLRVPDFVLPYAGSDMGFEVSQARYVTQGCEARMERGDVWHRVVEASHGTPDAQEARMFRAFAEGVRSGSVNEGWMAAALDTQRMLDACLSSLAGDGILRTP